MNRKALIIFFQILLLILIIFLWECLSRNNIINSFIFSSPSKILNCIINLYKENNLINHIFVTIKETIISFSLSIIISFIFAIVFYECKTLFKVVEPYLTVLNSMPKIALGPLFIILFGAGNKSIIIMALSVTLIVNILSIYNGFNNVDKYQIKLLDSLNATKLDNLKYLVIPSASSIIINSLKINISLTLVGVIMGEFLVSKAGIGYLIIYGTQIFNLTLVMSGIFILMVLSYILYLFISLIEKRLKKYLTFS